MRIFVTRVKAPTPIQEHGTKWQIVIEHEGARHEYDPERVTLAGGWTFGRDETGTPTVWLVPRVNGAVFVMDDNGIEDAFVKSISER